MQMRKGIINSREQFGELGVNSKFVGNLAIFLDTNDSKSDSIHEIPETKFHLCHKRMGLKFGEIQISNKIIPFFRPVDFTIVCSHF